MKDPVSNPRVGVWVQIYRNFPAYQNDEVSGIRFSRPRVVLYHTVYRFSSRRLRQNKSHEIYQFQCIRRGPQADHWELPKLPPKIHSSNLLDIEDVFPTFCARRLFVKSFFLLLRPPKKSRVAGPYFFTTVSRSCCFAPVIVLVDLILQSIVQRK